MTTNCVIQQPAVRPSSAAKWRSGTGPFHSAAWSRVLRETYGFRTCELPGGEALPLMEVSSPVTGRRGISLPFTDEVGMGDLSLQVFQSALGYGRARRWKYIELRGGECPIPSSAGPSASFHGHILELGAGEDALHARLESSVARAIRKAQRAGVQVEISDSEEAVRAYYRLHRLTRRKHGLPPQPWRFFRNLHRYMIAEDEGVVAIAKMGTVPIAGAIFLHVSGSEAVYKFGASDEAFQSFRPNNLVIWEAIRHYAARGCVALRFGRTELENEGLRRFKLSFGATEYPIHYWRYDARQETFVACSQQVAGWHNHLFRLMPRSLSRVAGAILYRHIA